MPKQRTVKYWIGQIHLWLGLVSGLVVFIVSITGCLFAFQEEISEVVYKHTFFIEARSGTPLPLTRLLYSAQTALGQGEPVNYITAYTEPNRAWEFMAYRYNDSAITYWGSMPYFRSVFINPYTGAVTGYRDYRRDFFSVVKNIHWSLLLNTPYGQPIVGWGTLVFVVLLITGLVLWWPKRWKKADRRRSFNIMWKARFKRLNYDLHNVLGFYSLLLALVIGLTGMVFAFTWFERAVHVVVSGTTAHPQAEVLTSDTTMAAPSAKAEASAPAAPRAAPAAVPGIPAASAGALDQVYALTTGLLPSVRRIGISPPITPTDVIDVSAYYSRHTFYDRTDLGFDRYSGRLLQRKDNAKQSRSERLSSMNYDIHVGAVWGLAGKILAFIISLICASLPVTGFLVWWGKIRKKK